MSSVDKDGEDGNGFILCKKIAKFFKFSSCLEKIAKKIILLNLLSSSQVQAIEKESGRVGLKLNTKKTKAMFFNTPPTTIQTLEGKSIGQAITNVADKISSTSVAGVIKPTICTPERPKHGKPSTS